MMTSRKKNQEGFALVLLAVVSLLAVNGMGVTTMNERMAGNHMDRGRAYAAAERALTQAQDFLRANADTCLAAGCVGSVSPSITGTTVLQGTGAAHPGTVLPGNSQWERGVDAAVYVKNRADETPPAPGEVSSRYLINWLSDPAFNAPGRVDCKSYSVMGRGVGKDTNTEVLLQTVAHVCPAD
jgi:type IV pilus assembly protein PilX